VKARAGGRRVGEGEAEPAAQGAEGEGPEVSPERERPRHGHRGDDVGGGVEGGEPAQQRDEAGAGDEAEVPGGHGGDCCGLGAPPFNSGATLPATPPRRRVAAGSRKTSGRFLSTGRALRPL